MLLSLLLALTLAACTRGIVPNSADSTHAADVFLRKGVRYLEQGQMDQASKDLHRALEFEPGNGEVQTAMARLHERLGHLPEAEAHYRRAVEVAPSSDPAANNLAGFLCRSGHTDEGVVLLERVLARNLYATPWLARTNLALCHKRAGRLIDAEALFRQALAERADFVPALIELADLRLNAGDAEDARDVLTHYPSMISTGPEALWLGVRVAHALGRHGDRDQYLRLLVARFPTAPEAVQARALFPTSSTAAGTAP